MARIEWTDAQKADALALLDANSGNIAATARSSGVPQQTIRHWRDGRGINGDVPKMGAEKRLSLAEMFAVEARCALTLAAEKRGEATYNDLLRAAGISTDKILALQAADREAAASMLTPDQIRDEAKALLEELGYRVLPIGETEATAQGREAADDGPKIVVVYAEDKTTTSAPGTDPDQD